MRFTVTKNFGPMADIEFFTKQDFERIGKMVRDRIIKRTLNGIDEEGRPFTAYSPDYLRLKTAALGATAGRVNLMLSGQMLEAITIEADETGVTLKFSS